MKNLKLATKIGLGFGIVLVLLATVAWFGFSGVRSDLAHLLEYRGLARENIKASDLNTQLLTVRLWVKEYFLTQSDTTLQEYAKAKTEMFNLVKQAKEEIKEPPVPRISRSSRAGSPIMTRR